MENNRQGNRYFPQLYLLPRAYGMYNYRYCTTEEILRKNKLLMICVYLVAVFSKWKNLASGVEVNGARFVDEAFVLYFGERLPFPDNLDLA